LPDIFKYIRYGGSYTGSNHKADWEKDSYLMSDIDKFPLIYHQPAGEFTLRLADKNDLDKLDYIMCQQNLPPAQLMPISPPKDAFMTLASHACKRDIQAIESQTDYTIQEIFAITNLNFTITTDPQWTNFFPQLIPLNEKERFETFWFSNLSNAHSKPDINHGLETRVDRSGRKKRQALYPWWDTTKNVESPFRAELWQQPKHPKCYYRPLNIFGQETELLTFPYEEWEIDTTVPSTLPDYVIILHTLWQIHVEKQYSEDSFSEWMAKQGKRVKLYQLLKHTAKIHAVQRKLESVHDENLYMAHKFRQNRDFRFLSLRTQRTIESLTNSVIEEMVVDRLQEMNITYEVFSKMNSTDLKTVLESHFNVKFDNITDFNISSTALPIVSENTETKSRPKRAIPLIPILSAIAGTALGATTTMLANAISSPNSNTPDSHHVKLLHDVAMQVKSISIDRQQTINVLNSVADRLQYFELQLMNKFDGITSITMGLDLKTMNQNLQTVSQLTMLKFNAAIATAADHRVSPYILPQEDLDSLVTMHQRLKGITLTHDLSQVKTTAILENNTIVFYIEVPIIDTKKDFSLYTVTPLPIFMDNTTLMPMIDSNHIAINHDGDKFTTLTDLQLAACLDTPPRCRSISAITPIRTKISCVATSYITNTQSCALVKSTSPPIPRFFFFDDTMVYSTPVETNIYILCPPLPGQPNKRDETMKISGFGMHKLAPKCSLTLPDGTTHVTPIQTETTEMENKLFHQIHQQQQPAEGPTFYDNTPVFENIPRIRSSSQKFSEIWSEQFHPATVTANTTQIIIIIIIVCSLALLLFYCRHKLRQKCCGKRRTIKIRDPTYTPNPEEPALNNWFVETDENQPDPDSISTLAMASSSPPRGSKVTQAFNSFYDSFPAWTKREERPTQPIIRMSSLTNNESGQRNQQPERHSFSQPRQEPPCQEIRVPYTYSRK
jgi:hypothetical protein